MLHGVGILLTGNHIPCAGDYGRQSWKCKLGQTPILGPNNIVLKYNQSQSQNQKMLFVHVCGACFSFLILTFDFDFDFGFWFLICNVQISERKIQFCSAKSKKNRQNWLSSRWKPNLQGKTQIWKANNFVQWGPPYIMGWMHFSNSDDDVAVLNPMAVL